MALYRAFLGDTLQAAQESESTVILAHTPGPSFPEQEIADISFEQRGTSFGERFDNALADAAKLLPTGTPLVLVGADTPHLPPRSMRQSLDALHVARAVIGPSLNGGFYLLGFSMPPVPVAKVFAQLASREVPELIRLLRKAGVTPKLLASWFDVDEPEDLAKLKSFISLHERVESEWIPQRTLTVLTDIGRVESIKRDEGGRKLESRLGQTSRG